MKGTNGAVIRSNLTAVMGLWQAQHNRDINLRYLAERTGLSKNFLHRFKTDQIQKLDLDKLQVLCVFFQVTPNDLIWVHEVESEVKVLQDGQPCDHPGCASHISHPCEGCGRIAAQGEPRG